ncbi:MAG: fumarylacetoacetate hydrolase family protein [Lunatimonas sp.]|uniref:fumarylacetoacetate hydrolase family protein n=1 Tax=Lunatimonas sp. TaxID=2060141 RepID=UPI00263BDBBA|nr:fumarylacetoacetate hydrolase family protein [Lunatimonas sp.]MCC5939561.1 fumarylacetoacetate hydrolase family protein [Lunatimonas sp.]
MKLYRTENGIVAEKAAKFYPLYEENWDTFINDDALFDKLNKLLGDREPSADAEASIHNAILPPVQSQEIWASGVTYFRSKLGRQEESKDSGGATFYELVYHADRPELFMKASGHRAVGHGDKVRIRKDSTWDVPEPELTLVITSSGKIVGYTVGNDMSSRSIEGENPLYLPQAKIYDGSAAVGPCILVTENPLSPNTQISLTIRRGGQIAFEDTIAISQIKRKFEDLVRYLFLEYTFPHGALLMTGTGIVPDSSFTLASGDEISIAIEGIGTLTNEVA